MQSQLSSKVQLLTHHNLLLQQRNDLLTHENQRMLCEVEMLTIELEQLRQQEGKRDMKVSYGSQGGGRTVRERNQYEELVTLRLEKEQILGIIRERLPVVEGKVEAVKEFADRVKVIRDVGDSGIYIGMLRCLFDLTEVCLDSQKTIRYKTQQLTDKQNSLKTQFQRKNSISLRTNNSNQFIVVKDPQYVVQQTHWINRFQTEFTIVKNFYQNLINRLLNRESYRSVKALLQNIMIRYEKMELKKLELHRLAIRIDNQEREYSVRVGKGASMESLRISIQKLSETLVKQQDQLRKLKDQIKQLICKIPN